MTASANTGARDEPDIKCLRSFEVGIYGLSNGAYLAADRDQAGNGGTAMVGWGDSPEAAFGDFASQLLASEGTIALDDADDDAVEVIGR